MSPATIGISHITVFAAIARQHLLSGKHYPAGCLAQPTNSNCLCYLRSYRWQLLVCWSCSANELSLSWQRSHHNFCSSSSTSIAPVCNLSSSWLLGTAVILSLPLHELELTSSLDLQRLRVQPQLAAVTSQSL